MKPLSRLFQQLKKAKSAQGELSNDDYQSIRKDLISAEAEIGGKLFGPIPPGHSREFFCLDDHTWVWSESWKGQNGRQTLTTRYELRGDQVMKVQNGTYYQLSLDEKKHLKRAIELYYQQVMQSLYPQYINREAGSADQLPKATEE